MRMRLPLGRTLFFLCAFLFALVALTPLRLAFDWLALESRGLAARDAQGSIWLGSLSEAQLGTVPLGDLQAQLRSLPLFVGRARVDLRRTGEDSFEGAATVTRNGFGLDDVKGRLHAAPLFAPLPIGRLALDNVSARFADGQCAHAEGKVTAAMPGELAGIALANGFSGSARCDGGALLLPLASRSATEMLNIRLFGDGRYQVELGVRPVNAATAQRLTAAGFAVSGDMFVIRKAGKL